MADGRTHQKYLQIYQNGYDLTGEIHRIGDLDWDYDFIEIAGLNWAIQGGYCERGHINTGQVNTILRFDTTAADSPHDWITGMDGKSVNTMIPFGIRASPVMGDPVWMAVHEQKSSKVTPADSGLVVGTINYSPSYDDALNNAMLYDIPWGYLLHVKAARTAASTATGHDNGAETSKGGWMMAQVFACAGTGNVTIKIQHASTNLNASFEDVTGLTTGAIANTAIPGAIVKQAAIDATIKQYTRWQIALSGITSVTFALAFVRGR